MGSGEPIFCEWFLHAACLWGMAGDWQRASWAREELTRSAGDSTLPDRLLAEPEQRPSDQTSEDGERPT